VAVTGRPTAQRLFAEQGVVTVRRTQEIGDCDRMDLATRPPPALEVGRGHRGDEVVALDDVGNLQVARE
jgi:hypothetical protein